MNITLVGAAKTVGAAVGGAALALAITWTGGQDLRDVEEHARNVQSKVIELVEDVKEYQAVISDKQIEINDLKGMYYEMEEKANALEAANRELVDAIEGTTSQPGYISELEKANSDAAVHKETMFEILDESIFDKVAE